MKILLELTMFMRIFGAGARCWYMILFSEDVFSSGPEKTAGVTSRLTKGRFVLSSAELMTISCVYPLLDMGDWTVLLSQQGGVHTYCSVFLQWKMLSNIYIYK